MKYDLLTEAFSGYRRLRPIYVDGYNCMETPSHRITHDNEIFLSKKKFSRIGRSEVA